jgi:hypothetical protein
VTIRIVRGLPNLRRRDLTKAIGESLRKGKQKAGFRVVHFSIQANHIHLIVEATGRLMLWRGMTGIGVRIARAVNGVLGRKGRVVADRYHSHALARPREVRNAIVYVLTKFKHHGGGRHRFDPCSSALWFGGWTERPPPPPTPAPVAEPRTWLLGVGWRRHGKIAPEEAPIEPG